MPEGHLLHRFARQHREHLGGRAIAASSPQGRFARGAAQIDGRVLDEVEAYGKHLFHRFDGSILHVHLGRQGTIVWLPAPPPVPRTSVRLRMAAEPGAADLIAPLRCELGDAALREGIVAGLGSDPLREDADPARVWGALQATGQAVGATLLDQSVVAGIGNVLRAELLNMAGVHPEAPAASVDRETFDVLWRTTVDTMATAAEEGRIITRRPDGISPSDLDEIEGRFVYRRDTCGRCGSPVERLTLANRDINACPVCQPRRPHRPVRARNPAGSVRSEARPAAHERRIERQGGSMSDVNGSTAEAVRLEAAKTKETADRMANGESTHDKDDIRVLAGMVKQVAEQVERLAALVEGDR